MSESSQWAIVIDKTIVGDGGTAVSARGKGVQVEALPYSAKDKKQRYLVIQSDFSALIGAELVEDDLYFLETDAEYNHIYFEDTLLYALQQRALIAGVHNAAKSRYDTLIAPFSGLANRISALKKQADKSDRFLRAVAEERARIGEDVTVKTPEGAKVVSIQERDETVIVDKRALLEFILADDAATDQIEVPKSLIAKLVKQHGAEKLRGTVTNKVPQVVVSSNLDAYLPADFDAIVEKELANAESEA